MDKAGNRSIYVGLGGNLAHPRYGPPMATLRAALAELAATGVEIQRVSPWYRSAPVPPSHQPWYFNAVVEVGTGLSADRLLAGLHAIERKFGRVRSTANAPRAIDLDLLDYRGEIAAGGREKATLPHPRLAERAFVLLPLADLAPNWRHPASGKPISELIAALPADQRADRV